jgi:hypothetical protein
MIRTFNLLGYDKEDGKLVDYLLLDFRSRTYVNSDCGHTLALVLDFIFRCMF